LNDADEQSKLTDVMQHKLNVNRLFAMYYKYKQDFRRAVEYQDRFIEAQKELYAELSERLISKQEAEYLRGKIEKQNEANIQKNRELERSNKLIKKQSRLLEKSNKELHNSLSMLNRLISVISHDVRGPAANSAAALRLILGKDLKTSSSQEIVHHVIDNLDSVTDLLAEIMVWIESRSFTKDVERLKRDVDLVQITKQVLRFFQGQIRQKQLQIDISFDEPEMMIHSESHVLRIALRNIMSNAIKFTPERKSIHIRCTRQEGIPVLCIEDSGIGMDETELKKLRKSSLKSKQGTNSEIGMGMGLKLSLSYLKLLNIDYSIQSQKDKGTRFTLKMQKPGGRT
jgi:signal transduction histidine kinase